MAHKCFYKGKVMLDDIILFVKLIDAGGFSKLAKSLGISQSTISRKIENLEMEMKVRLIKRDSRNVELTPKGEILFNNFKDFEFKNNSIIQQIINSPDKVTGKLKILLASYFANYAITPHLAEFCQNYKDLEVTIVYDYQNLHMTQGGYDIAITTFPPEKSPPRNIVRVHSERIIAVCNKDYYQKYGIPIDFENIEQHFIVGKLFYGQPEIDTLPVYKISTPQILNVPNPLRLRINSFMEARTMLKSGRVIVGLPESSIRNELLEGKLINAFPDYHFGFVNYHMIRNIEAEDPRFLVFNAFLTNCINMLNVKFDDDLQGKEYKC